MLADIVQKSNLMGRYSENVKRIPLLNIAMNKNRMFIAIFF